MNREQLLAKTLDRMTNIDAPNQILGRSHTIGCVAVEITQRCNLDCTLCYLSENSQAVRDLPISEVFRRLDDVVKHYGTGINVQITGGDPTLRKHKELIKIVRYASSIGLYPALFTNGIAATRPLLKTLAEAGLKDIAFHVDTTQERKGYISEKELNEIRQEYIERTRGLGLMVIFNTTIHTDNFAELPILLNFFRKNADAIGLVSFNLQAETGRGEWGSRKALVSMETVRTEIEKLSTKPLPWGVVRVGHNDCHSYMPTLVVDETLYAIVEDPKLVGDFLKDFQHLTSRSYKNRAALIRSGIWAILLKPSWWHRAIGYSWSQLRAIGAGLLASKGKAHKLTFFIQNFMDAKQLDQERIDACSFMVMTADGPVSMCEHNSRRDDFILKPIKIMQEDGRTEIFEPLPIKAAQNYS